MGKMGKKGHKTMSTVKIGDYTIVKSHGKQEITHPDKLGKITVYGNGHVRETFYAVPDWSEEEEEAITYKGETYFLSEFEYIDKHMPKWMQAFDGYHGDSFFSGILVKYVSEGYWLEGYQVYTYIA